MSATLMGVSRVAQLDDNSAALDTRLSADPLATLDEASAPDKKMLYRLFTPSLRQQAVFGGSAVRGVDRVTSAAIQAVKS